MKQTKNTTASEEHGHEQYQQLTLDLIGLRELEVHTGTGDDAVDEGGRGARRRRPKDCSGHGERRCFSGRRARDARGA